MFLSLLGRARIDGVELRSTRQRRLLAALVLHRGTGVSAERLTEYVWGGESPENPPAALHTLISRLRSAIAGHGTITARSGHYELTVAPGTLDIDSVTSWRARTADLQPAARVAELQLMLGLFRGSPYDDLDDVDVLPVKEQLGEVRLALLEALAEDLLVLDRNDAAIEVLRLIVGERPDRENTVIRLMEALYEAGRQLEALAAATALRDYLREEFGVDPSHRLTETEVSILRHELHRDVTGPTPAPTRVPPLSRRLTSLVGRAGDLQGVTALLQRARLVTLLGPGGIGKTTLALHVAAHLQTNDAPVFVVELSDIEPGVDLFSVVAGRVGGLQFGVMAPGEALCQHFDVPETVLVLDNCEHLLDEVAPFVHQLLTNTDHLRVLATSREPLKVSGEHRWMLHPLELRDACHLFIERVRSVDPDFSGTPGDERIADLCTRLDGLPLALELAASNVSAMSVDEMITLLDDRFSLLRSRGVGTPERHKSLAATLAWSYSRLGAAEQHAFDRLGVFAGSFTNQDVRDLIGEQTQRHLMTLVDRSMVMCDRSATPSRFELLDSLRAYARLQRGEALAEDRDRHARWVATSVAMAAAHVNGPMELMWFRWFRSNMANIRQAHQWFLESGNDDERIKLLVGLIMWAWQAEQAEVMAWAESLDDETHTDDPNLIAAKIAVSAIAVSRTKGATARLSHITTAAAEQAPLHIAALAFYAAAEIDLFTGALDRAETNAQRAYECATRSLHVRESQGIAFFAAIDAAYAYGWRGQLPEASRWADLAQDLAQSLDSASAHAWVHLVRSEMLEHDSPTRSLVHIRRCSDLVDSSEQAFLARVVHSARLAIEDRARRTQIDRDAVLMELTHPEDLSWYAMTSVLHFAAALLVQDGHANEAAIIVAATVASSVDPVSVTRRAENVIAAINTALPEQVARESEAEGSAWSLPEAIQLATQLLRRSGQ